MTDYKGTEVGGLTIKNGKIVNEPSWDSIFAQTDELVKRINAGPQPARIKREKALAEARNKKRR